MSIHHQNQKLHNCRICKKSFASGRALGGHMRAHAINDEPTPDPTGVQWATAAAAAAAAAGQQIYTISAVPNRNRRSRICENCGKEFYSLKLLLKHNCSTSIVAAGDVAAAGDLSPPSSPYRGKRIRHGEEEDLAETGDPPVSISRGKFECVGCKKVFPSHQALGGHRATHKKVKGCFAARLQFDAKNEFLSEETPLSIAPLRKKSIFYECSVCKREFLTGQALGGHKRRHWGASKIGEFSGAAAIGSAGENGIPVRFEVPIAIYVEPRWGGGEVEEKAIDGDLDGGDERKEVKLVDLSGLNEGEESSTWLQIGIGSTAEF